MTITSLFYKNLLDGNPELRNIFNEANQVGGAQPRALASAVLAYATYLDDLGKLSDAVERIAHKHTSLNVQPEQYPIVGKFLLEAVATVLGDACTSEIAEAVSRNLRFHTTSVPHGPWESNIPALGPGAPPGPSISKSVKDGMEI
jgi:hemoglobin-like flavoprotein